MKLSKSSEKLPRHLETIQGDSLVLFGTQSVSLLLLTLVRGCSEATKCDDPYKESENHRGESQRMDLQLCHGFAGSLLLLLPKFVSKPPSV
jgi:hypothetical protein